MPDFFEALVEKFCPSSPPNLAEKMRKYAEQVAIYNSKMDLVAAKTEEEILRRHVLDSLCAAPALALRFSSKDGICVADVGSGAGFPGIPLAAAFPSVKFTLIERMSKRCAFLENCAAVLGLKNIFVENCEVERCERKRFDCAVFRAFRPLKDDIAETLFSLLREGGFLAAYKAKISMDSEEVRAVSRFCRDCKIVPLESSFLSEKGERYERSVLIAEKQPDISL